MSGSGVAVSMCRVGAQGLGESGMKGSRPTRENPTVVIASGETPTSMMKTLDRRERSGT